MSLISKEQLEKLQNNSGSYSEQERILSLMSKGSAYTNVLCNDGSTQRQENSPNGRFADACRNNRGKAKNQDALIKKNTINNTSNQVLKYVFNQDYEAKGTNLIPKGSKIASYMLSYSFKKGDVFEGEKTPTNSDVESDSKTRYNVNIFTSEASKVDSTKFAGKSIFEVPEIVVTELSLTTDTSGETFIQKNKINLLIAGALVLGYFAYKKSNK